MMFPGPMRAALPRDVPLRPSGHWRPRFAGRELQLAGLSCLVGLSCRSRHQRRATELLEALESLEAMRRGWRELRLEDVLEAQELMRREAELREQLVACEYGDPNDTWTPLSSSHPVVKAHHDVARKLIETELERLQFTVRCGESLGHPDLPLGKQSEAVFSPFLGLGPGNLNESPLQISS